MSDDLFWPPVSGEGDDDREPQLPTGADDGHPTAAFDTEPLAGSAAAAQPATEPGSNGHSRFVATAGVVAIIAFVFGAGGVLVGAKAFKNTDNDSSASLVPAASSAGSAASPSALNTTPKSYAAIAAKVLPSVVSINVTGSSESDTGSGIILKSNGYILTNNHVVAAAVSTGSGGSGGSVSVVFNDGTTSSATIVGTDALDDLAVIKVARTGLSAATLGNSSSIAVGDPVLAVGSPLGLTGTVTAGIVSSLNRPVETQQETQAQPADPFGGSGSSSTTAQPTVIEAIQTDAAINPGNSGGALVNSVGQVIGVNSAIASLDNQSLSGSQSGSIGVGFAIPVNQARTIANELISTGHAVHPLLGVSLEDSTSSTGVDRAVVHGVTSGGPAAKAGIKNGDVITAVDGQTTQGVDAVIAAIRSHQPGEKVTVDIERSGSTQTLTTTLTTESSTSD